MHSFCTRSHLAALLMVACAFALSGMAVAQTWSSPQLVANGNGQAISTNGSGTSAVPIYEVMAEKFSGYWAGKGNPDTALKEAAAAMAERVKQQNQ